MDPERGVFLVVDGVGGQAAGEVAAETAVEAIRDRDLGGAADGAHAATPSRRQQSHFRAGRRATRAARHGLRADAGAGRKDDDVMIGHVGDSRLYLIWNGAIRKLTPDHSPVGEGRRRGRVDRGRGHDAPAPPRGVSRRGLAAPPARRPGIHRNPPVPLPPGCGAAAVQRRPDRPPHRRRRCARSWSAMRATRRASRRTWWRRPTTPGAGTTSPRCSWPGRSSAAGARPRPRRATTRLRRPARAVYRPGGVSGLRSA